METGRRGRGRLCTVWAPTDGVLRGRARRDAGGCARARWTDKEEVPGSSPGSPTLRRRCDASSAEVEQDAVVIDELLGERHGVSEGRVGQQQRLPPAAA